MNIQIITGYLGADAQVKQFEDGTIINCRVGDTTKGYTTKSGRTVADHTEWFNVVIDAGVNSKLGDFLKKGTFVTVSGKTKARSFTGNDGQKRYISEVWCRPGDVVFINNRKDDIPGPDIPSPDEAPY